MTGAWRDYVRRVIRLDEEELELWRRIAGMVSPCCRRIIEMMIKGEEEEMEALRALCREDDSHCPERPPCPDYGPDRWPCPPERPCPGKGPDYSYDPNYDPMPYTNQDKEGK